MCGSAGSRHRPSREGDQDRYHVVAPGRFDYAEQPENGVATAKEAEGWAQEQIKAARTGDTERQPDVQFSRGGAKEQLLAPNGKPSNLNERQWKQVRTERFKQWFGDWEAAEHRRFLDGKPVYTLRGDEFAPDGVPLTEKYRVGMRRMAI